MTTGPTNAAAAAVDRRRPIIYTMADAKSMYAQLLLGAEHTAAWVRQFSGQSLDLLKALRFEAVGHDPVSGEPLNVIEQLNQTFTILVALRATEMLLDLHPDAGGYQLALGALSGRDVVSIQPNLVAAEVFAAVDPNNNSKLRKDTTKLVNDPSRHRYGIRRWRDSGDQTDLTLSCSSEPQITLRLRGVARWATASGSRVHFEWVWDGSRLWIVQGDVAVYDTGVDPTSLAPDVLVDISPSVLSVFEPASEQHFARYGKLRNAKLYTELGYEMPPFYVLMDAELIREILTGRIPEPVQHDLEQLTQRPLIIRTDGLDIPSGKKEMLPRSDELRSAAEAAEWLRSKYSAAIRAAALDGKQLCLIAHHFIPSVSSAWARAEPAKRMVRVESLWGIPEGLYWYSHDTFELDTQSGVPATNKTKYPIWRRLRYKGTFIASDSTGHWVPYHTAVPFDWRPSVQRERWLYEIASTTRLIADREKFPVNVMWFVGNDSRATRHVVLPWFHNQSELGAMPKAAPRRKLAIARDYVIEKRANWEQLQQEVRNGRHVERIIVSPTDAELIRNRDFAEELGKLASAHNIVVELAGGILSHAFYVLQGAGVQVECIDLFGAEDDVVEYNKIVRDKIPAIIEGRGERVEIIKLVGDALIAGLRQKLVEEAYEALDAKGGEDIVGELADVQEVLDTIVRALQLEKRRVKREQIDKQRRRGGFDRGYMLKRTTTPHSLSSASQGRLDEPSMISPRMDLKPVVADASDIPKNPPYRRPDLRTVEDETEKLFTFETEVNKIGGAREVTSFELPLGEEGERRFTLTVEFNRHGSALRGTVRLRLQPKQMKLPVDDYQLPLPLRFPDTKT